jgi:hypothetical protein
VHVSASDKRIAVKFAIQHALALTRRIRARVLQLKHPNRPQSLLHMREHFQLLLLPLQAPEASWSQQQLHPLEEQGACPQPFGPTAIHFSTNTHCLQDNEMHPK